MKELSQEDFIKSVEINGIDGEKIISLIYQKHLDIKKGEMEKLLSVTREYFDSLLFYGFNIEEANELLSLIMNKYGDLKTKEIMHILYSAMTSCRDSSNISLRERLMYIDGIYYATLKYAKFRNELKDLDSDDITKVMLNALNSEQGDFLTEEEKEYMSLGIINICLVIPEVEKGKQKKL